MEMEEKEIVFLENNSRYIILDEINDYVYLSNVDDNNDFCIRKNIIINNEEMLEGLEDEDEVKKAMMLFYDKHQEMLNDLMN